jgi:hypothetical protein
MLDQVPTTIDGFMLCAMLTIMNPHPVLNKLLSCAHAQLHTLFSIWERREVDSSRRGNEH